MAGDAIAACRSPGSLTECKNLYLAGRGHCQERRFRRFAALETVRSIIEPTPAGQWHSAALCADGSYGIEKGLICSFSIRLDGGKVEIVQDLPLDEFSKARIETSVDELKEWRALVGDLIPS